MSSGETPIEQLRANGGDHTEQRECPRCGRDVVNTRWADHLRNCEGGDDGDR